MKKRLLGIVLILVLVWVSASQVVFGAQKLLGASEKTGEDEAAALVTTPAAGAESNGTPDIAAGTDADADSGADSEAAPEAKRTIMLYICGSNLEDQGAMATHNLKQILASRFSSDDDVRVIVMTGGSDSWHLDDDDDPNNENGFLAFPEGVNLPYDAVMIDNPDIDDFLNPDAHSTRRQI